MKPGIGSIVHYVSYGTPVGNTVAPCRTAVIAGLHNNDEVDLVILKTGTFFNRCHQYPGNSDGPVQDATCVSSTFRYPGGTWHKPEHVY